ncbi:MAG: thiamine pyrophosphate-dependent enzyme, partial [Gemmatimonadaceae bacterium]
PRGFHGAVPIVAGTVPLAVGAALAAKLRGQTSVSVAYFGDGAMEEGAVQESLNLARMLKVPAVFVVENNFYSSHMHVSLRQPLNFMARFAAANDIACEIVDGNDVVAVSRAAERLVGRAREGNGPGFLEAVTYRWYGHVDWREDLDVGVDRSATHLAEWRARDPVLRLSRAMQLAQLWSAVEEEELRNELDRSISLAWSRAMNDPWPPASALLDRVYAQRTSQ